jgi:hypothetical protein
VNDFLVSVHVGRSRDRSRWEFGMHVVECDVPSSSVLSRDLIENAYFRDSYRAPLSRKELGIVDISSPYSRITPCG